MKKFLVISNTYLERRATVEAKDANAAILAAYGVWDRDCAERDIEPPVSWGCKSVTEVCPKS